MKINECKSCHGIFVNGEFVDCPYCGSMNVSIKKDYSKEINMREYDGLEVKSYDGEDSMTISVSSLSQRMSKENWNLLLSDYLNNFGNAFTKGYFIGLLFRTEHRALHPNLVDWVMGLLQGLSEQQYLDARNQQAVERAKFLLAADHLFTFQTGEDNELVNRILSNEKNS